jgi:hypothetical protein
MKELNTFRKFIQEAQMKSDTDKMNQMDFDEPIEEGTWSLGTVGEMVKVMGKLSQIRKMGAAKGSVELENLDRALYNVFGDDEFQDAIDAAKGTDDDDRFNNFIGDAEARAKELYRDELRDAKEQGETGFEQEPRFGLEENDTVLEEVSESMGIFREIDMMIGSIKDQMNPDDAFDSLVSEFEAISGGTKLLHQALKNISLDNNLGEIRSAYNESLEEATKPDEKEIKAAAAKLMKDPKFKAQYKGKKGVDFVKHAMAVAKKSMKKSK